MKIKDTRKSTIFSVTEKQNFSCDFQDAKNHGGDF